MLKGPALGRPATYEDLQRVPDHLVAEIVDGELYATPRPALRHALQTATGYSAYSPDVPGCVATGGTHEEIEREMKEAIFFHLDGFRHEGLSVPEPHTSSFYVEVPV